MEIWFVIGVICSIGYVGVWIIDLYENIQFNKIMRQCHLKEVRRATRQINKSERQKQEEKIV